MVLIKECDDTSKAISPTNSNERNQLRSDYLKHARWSNDSIDWEAYELGLFGCRVLGNYVFEVITFYNRS